MVLLADSVAIVVHIVVHDVNDHSLSSPLQNRKRTHKPIRLAVDERCEFQPIGQVAICLRDVGSYVLKNSEPTSFVPVLAPANRLQRRQDISIG